MSFIAGRLVNENHPKTEVPHMNMRTGGCMSFHNTERMKNRRDHVFLRKLRAFHRKMDSQKEVFTADRISNLLCQLRRNEEIEQDGLKAPFKL